jgi:uncharacterized membrane protein
MAKNFADLAQRWLSREPGALSAEQSRVLHSTVERKPISRNINVIEAHEQTFGERLADTIARVGGSWTFILAFLGFLVFWTAVNTVVLLSHAFDPYPFIFLNLILSMLAAIQAPIIMMSQNRQAERDRIDATHDYEVNLKAEIEIMALHEKFDEIRHNDILALREEVQQLRTLLERLEVQELRTLLERVEQLASRHSA